jgi:hypothetical protein
MDRRFKIITIAISVVYVAIIGRGIYREMADFMYGFRQGLKEGLISAETGITPSLSATGTFFLFLKPEAGLRTFPTNLRNQLDRKPMRAEIEQMVVEASDIRERLPKGTLAADICSVVLSFFALFIIALIPVQTFRVVRSITLNKIFDPANIRKLRTIGYALLAFYLANFVINFFHYRVAKHVVQVDGYTLQMDWGDITLVLLGFVVLMFAEMLKVSVQMKEEQDLTV